MPYKDPIKDKESHRVARIKNKERYQMLAHLRYLKNKEHILSKSKEWRENNLEKSKTTRKKYYYNNKQQAIDTAKRWKKRNPNKVKDGRRIYREKNKELIKIKSANYNKSLAGKASAKKYRDKNKEKILIKRKKYKENHPEYMREYVSRRRKNDIQFKLKGALRHRIYKALKGNPKKYSSVKGLGCTIPELKIYLENKFQEGMSWDNWTYNGWHIDHINPLDSFDMTNEDDLKIVCHYTNLQPMWGDENIRKGNKILK